VKTVKLCNSCRDTSGLLYDETTDPPTVTKCPCRDQRVTAEQARVAAMSTVDWSKPQQRAAAYRILEQAAIDNQYLDADVVRERMDLAQIDAAPRTAAFRLAVAEGLLEPDGEVRSTHPPTHGKKIVRYRSRSFARQLGMGA
jgi:hypothetical protein